MLLAHSPLEAPAAGGARGRWAPEGGQGREAPLATMASSYAHAMERQALLPARLDGPAGLDNLQAKKNFSVSHLLDLEEAGDMVAAQAEEGGGEPGRSLLESPGLTSGSDTPQQDSKCGGILSIPSIPRRLRGGSAGASSPAFPAPRAALPRRAGSPGCRRVEIRVFPQPRPGKGDSARRVPCRGSCTLWGAGEHPGEQERAGSGPRARPLLAGMG